MNGYCAQGGGTLGKKFAYSSAATEEKNRWGTIQPRVPALLVGVKSGEAGQGGTEKIRNARNFHKRKVIGFESAKRRRLSKSGKFCAKRKSVGNGENKGEVQSDLIATKGKGVRLTIRTHKENS